MAKHNKVNSRVEEVTPIPFFGHPTPGDPISATPTAKPNKPRKKKPGDCKETMADIKSLDLNTLLAMQSAYTSKYNKMVIGPNVNSEEFHLCETMVKCIHEEIAARVEKSKEITE